MPPAALISNLCQSVLIKNTLILVQNRDIITLGHREQSEYEPSNKKWCAENNIECDITDNDDIDLGERPRTVNDKGNLNHHCCA